MSEIQFASAPVSNARPRTPNGRRAEAAVALRVAGHTYESIARTLGYANATVAMRKIEQELARTTGPAEKSRQRDLANRRLESLLAGTWAKAADPEHPEHLNAVRAAKDLIDRLIRLNGLDAPTEIVVHNPTEAEIEAWVAQMVSSGVRLTEADIIEGEVVDDATQELT